MPGIDLTPTGGIAEGTSVDIEVAFELADGQPATITSSGEVTATVNPAGRGKRPVLASDITIENNVARVTWLCETAGRHHVHVRWSDGIYSIGYSAFFRVGT
ncbi:MAG: hypothetical protein AAGF99_00475 [Bacteroidota bacterium]